MVTPPSPTSHILPIAPLPAGLHLQPGEHIVDEVRAQGGQSSGYYLSNLGGVFAVGSSTGDVGTPNVGFFDAFVLRLDASGALVWSRRIGSAADDYGWALARLADGDVVVGGRTDGVLADGFGWGGDGYLRRLGP